MRIIDIHEPLCLTCASCDNPGLPTIMVDYPKGREPVCRACLRPLVRRLDPDWNSFVDLERCFQLGLRVTINV